MKYKHAVRTGPVVGAPGVGETEEDVVGGALVQVGQELLDAELESVGQPRLVGLHQDAESVDLLEVGDEAEDLSEVHTVLLDASESAK